MRNPLATARIRRLAWALIFALLTAMPAPRPALAQEAMVLATDAARLRAHTGQGDFTFSIEIADDSSEMARGLMYRETMPADHGMLFDFGTTRLVTMWMKNTPMSLDMVFILADGTVARVAERTTPFSEDIVGSGEPVAFVLELRAGVSRLIGLKAGDRLIHPVFER